MDHPLLAFGIFAGLAGPLVPLVPLDSGGFHIYGASSKGKPTLLQEAATVWGNGAESPVLEDSSLRAHRTWQLLALSTGEISLRDKIQEDLGRKAYAGQLARLIDVRIPDEGAVDALCARPRQPVEALKRACGHHYGTAGPVFIQALLEEAAPGDADGPSASRP